MSRHEFPIDVRWSDIDILGHVNNAVYLAYFESARVELVRSVYGFPRKEGIGAVVVQANISYKQSVTYPAALKVVTTLPRIGNTSMTYHHRLLDRHGETLYSEADITVVWIRLEDGKPVPVPGFVKQWVAQEPA